MAEVTSVKDLRAQRSNARKPVAQAAAGPDANALAAVRALLVDIDDTIVTPVDNAGDMPYAPSTGSIMDVLRRAGVELGRLSAKETEMRIERVQQDIRWWHWSDFIVALELNPKTFWEYAYETERRYMQATGPEIADALARLRRHGIRLYVTSNNPSSGILHKLRLAGIGSIHGCELFDQLLGGTELHAMKWEEQYWKKALAHIGMEAGEVAVVGDNPRDDWEVPHSVGIPFAFLINRKEDKSRQNGGGLFCVQSFTAVADLLLAGR